MPLLKLHTSVVITGEKQEKLMTALSAIVASAIGKPETYVMVTFQSGPLCMGGSCGPGAFVEVRSIGGLNKSVNAAMCEQITGLLVSELDVLGERVYLNFEDVRATDWGWNGRTFG